jgi:hypothetical protein
MTIIGGRDLSTTAGVTFDGVRERTKASSLANDNVDSMDCLRSECDVRGRGIGVGMRDAGISRTVELDVEEGAVMNCCEEVVGPADGGGEMNWNCWEVGPTRYSAGDEAGAGEGGAERAVGCGGNQSSVCMEISLSSSRGFAGGVMVAAVVSSGATTSSFSWRMSQETATDSYVRGGGEGEEGVTGEGWDDEAILDMPWRLGKRDALILSSSLSEKSLSVTVRIEW